MLNSDTSRTPHGTVVPTRLPIGPWATTPAIHRVMQGNRSRDTKPEIAVAISRTCVRDALSRFGAPVTRSQENC
jgi:hypothetical protein